MAVWENVCDIPCALFLAICPLSRDRVYHPEEKIGLLEVQFGCDTEVVLLNHCAPLEMLWS